MVPFQGDIRAKISEVYSDGIVSFPPSFFAGPHFPKFLKLKMDSIQKSWDSKGVQLPQGKTSLLRPNIEALKTSLLGFNSPLTRPCFPGGIGVVGSLRFS